MSPSKLLAVALVSSVLLPAATSAQKSAYPGFHYTGESQVQTQQGRRTCKLYGRNSARYVPQQSRILKVEFANLAQCRAPASIYNGICCSAYYQ